MMIRKRYMIAFLLLFITELCIGLFVRDTLIRPFLGDVFVVILIYLLIRAFFTPKTKRLPVYIFMFALIVEIGQLMNVLQIVGLENNHFAKIIFGATFDVKDILCYLAGCLLIMLWQKFESIHLKK